MVIIYVAVRIEPTLFAQKYVTMKDQLNPLFTLNIPFPRV